MFFKNKTNHKKLATAFNTSNTMNEDRDQNRDFSDKISKTSDDNIADKNFEPSDDEKI